MPTHERVHGPYPHRNRYRIVYVDHLGGQAYQSFATEGEALTAIEEIKRAQNAVTVEDAIEKYVAQLENQERSNRTEEDRLRGFLKANDRLLESVTNIRVLLISRRADCAHETCRNELKAVRRFFRWAVAKGFVKRNPCDGVEMPRTKKRSRGKPQLRVDEAVKLVRMLELDNSKQSTAVLMTILLGLRASEVVKLCCRDVDAGGKLLVVERSKSRAGDRVLPIPALLAPRLVGLARNRDPFSSLFDRNGKQYTRYWVRDHAIRFSRKAEVPRVTPHGLRGSFTSLGVLSRTPIDVLATLVGHADGGDTLRNHYLSPGVEQAAQTKLTEDYLDI